MTSLPIPQGYEVYPLHMGYTDLIGPLYRRTHEDAEWFGLRIEPRHANRGPMAHGGLIASLADIVVGRAAARTQDPRRGCLSIHLEVDYLRTVPIGSWFEASATPVRVGSSVGFVDCQMLADGELAAKARGILKFLSSVER